MSSFGTIPLDEIWAMLNACAPGHKRKERQHNWLITYQGRSFPRLPRGPHGKRHNPPIEIGHVKTMVRHLGIEECAKQHLAQLQ